VFEVSVVSELVLELSLVTESKISHIASADFNVGGVSVVSPSAETLDVLPSGLTVLLLQSGLTVSIVQSAYLVITVQSSFVVILQPSQVSSTTSAAFTELNHKTRNKAIETNNKLNFFILNNLKY